MYRNTLLSTNMCVSLRLNMDILRIQTLHIKSGLVTIKYMRLLTICLNTIASVFTSPPSYVNLLLGTIGFMTPLQPFIPNLSRTSFAYFLLTDVNSIATLVNFYTKKIPISPRIDISNSFSLRS